jgi:hypothetical protein
MRTLLFRRLFVVLGVASAFLLAFAPLHKSEIRSTSAQVSANFWQTQSASPDVYLVQIIILNISDIDLTAGTYAVDFFISFECKNPPCKYEPAWDVMNSTEEISPEDQGTSQSFVEYDYRLKTTLIGKVDYRFYPFDYLYIEMFIEDKEYTKDQLTYQYDYIEVDPMLFNPSGWFYLPANNGGETQAITYHGNPEQYDRFDVWILLERDWFGAFMKTIFAALVIVLIGMLSFLMKPEAAGERLALTSSTLVAIVLYHISLVASVPATGYLTFIDKFMIGTYVVVFFALMISVLLMVYKNNEQMEKAEKLHQRTRWIIPASWVVLVVLVFVFELIIPYHNLVLLGGGV